MQVPQLQSADLTLPVLMLLAMGVDDVFEFNAIVPMPHDGLRDAISNAKQLQVQGQGPRTVLLTGMCMCTTLEGLGPPRATLALGGHEGGLMQMSRRDDVGHRHWPPLGMCDPGTVAQVGGGQCATHRTNLSSDTRLCQALRVLFQMHWRIGCSTVRGQPKQR